MSSAFADEAKPGAGDAVGRAADKAKDAADKAVGWVERSGQSKEVKQAAASLAEGGKDAIDAASSSARHAADIAKGAADQGWDAAQRAKAQVGDIASGLYDRGQRAGAELVRQTQEQPLAAVLVSMAAGVVVGFALAFAMRRD